MKLRPQASSWFSTGFYEPGLEFDTRRQEFERLWRAFMTARVTLGLVLLLLQIGIHFILRTQSNAALQVCAAYFTAALVVRLMTHPQQLGHTFDSHWLRTIGVDLLAFAALQSLEGGSINYTALFALPVLMASVLGTLIIALGTAAGVTLLLFSYAAWQSIHAPWDSATHFFQAALTGAGCFAISFLASQLANRLASMEQHAQRSQLAAAVQRQVNELVVSSLSDGILVVDEHSVVRSANPAARMLLGVPPESSTLIGPLTSRPAWLALLELVNLSYLSQSAQQSDITICHQGQGDRHLRVRTQLTTPLEADAEALCVVFMQDQREMQARLRTEKLASMGRMSAAVAHEIRNPLAAIVQANALLSEDLSDPTQLRMTQLVKQNAQRLDNIVRDVLHLTEAQHGEQHEAESHINLTEAVKRICRDWQRQAGLGDALMIDLPATAHYVWFDAEHLRRILVNLLDNARRFSSGQYGSIQVSVTATDSTASTVRLCVWSDGGPMEPSMEQHLFEPFFSSDSRSSGLGLYICRQLCEGHGATMTYDRSTRQINQRAQPGNEFSTAFRPYSASHQIANGQTTATP